MKANIESPLPSSIGVLHADFAAIKKAYRNRAKEVHPDVKPGDAEAARRFQALQVAYEVLRKAEERREWRG